MIDYRFSPGDRVHLSTAVDERTGSGLVESMGVPVVYAVESIADHSESDGPVATLKDVSGTGEGFVPGVNVKRLVPITD